MKSKGGFTLVELIIVILILSVIMVTVSEVYLRGMISSRSEISESQLQLEAKNVLDGMTDNIKMASLVEQSYGGYVSDTSQLVLAIPAIDIDDNFLYNGSNMVYDHIVYYKDGDNLHKLVISEDSDSRLFSQNGSDRVLLTNTKTLIFDYMPALSGAKVITVALTVTDDTRGASQDISLTAEGRIRND